MNRRSVMATGLLGLLGSLVMTAGAIYVMAAGMIPALVSRPFFVWALFVFLLTFSLLEIPVMTFALRRMAISINPNARYVLLFTNAAYTMFGGVYALPFILLAGGSWRELLAGAGLASLSFVRFATSVVMIPNDP
jgi:hypothetical protein